MTQRVADMKRMCEALHASLSVFFFSKKKMIYLSIFRNMPKILNFLNLFACLFQTQGPHRIS